MVGDIVLIGSSLLVSNNATLDIHSDVEGGQVVKIKVFEIEDPYGIVKVGETVEIAFKAEDESKFSYKGIVTKYSEIRAVVQIKELTENYQNIIRRAREWQV